MKQTNVRDLDPAERKGKTLARDGNTKFICEDCGQFYFSVVSLDELHSDRCNICGGKIVEVRRG